jgi:hypothetical protein
MRYTEVDKFRMIPVRPLGFPPVDDSPETAKRARLQGTSGRLEIVKLGKRARLMLASCYAKQSIVCFVGMSHFGDWCWNGPELVCHRPDMLSGGVDAKSRRVGQGRRLL